MTVRAACQAFTISETCYRYQPKLSDENAEIADWLVLLTNRQRNWGASCASCIYVTSGALAGTISVFIGFTATRVIRVLDRIIEWRGQPCTIRCDNGPEYVSELLATWAAKHGIGLQFIQPGKPQQNAYVERYNRTVRYDWG